MSLRRLAPRLVLGSLLLAALPALRADSLTETQIRELFLVANDQFRRGNELSRTDPIRAKVAYQGALIRYQRIVEEGGIHNGKLFYNIGNVYFRLNDLGRAILNYRRAQQFLGSDENLAQNLRYARSRRVDQIEPRQETQVLETLLFWHYDLAPRTRITVFALFFVGFWLLAALRLFFSGRVPMAALALCGGIAALFLGSLSFDAMSSNTGDGVVVAEQVVARKGDGDTYEPSFNEPLHAGTEFSMVENRGDWYQVELADGQRCWLPASAVGLVRGS